MLNYDSDSRAQEKKKKKKKKEKILCSTLPWGKRRELVTRQTNKGKIKHAKQN